MQDAWGEMTSEAIQAICSIAAPRNSLLRQPAFRRIYLVFFVFSTLFVLLPLWTIYYLPRANRPRQSWTIQRCLRVRWSRRICGLVARCEIDYLGRDLRIDMDPLKLVHSHPLTIAPAPLSWLRGHPAETLKHIRESTWDPHFVHRLQRDKSGVWGRWHRSPRTEYGFAPVKAFWYTGEKATSDAPPQPRQPDEPVMLHFHGGGYLCGTAAETDLTSSIPKSLVKHSPVHHILSVDYRLAPTAPWPLPLLDAISAYYHLVHVEGMSERDIIVAGDSAGGHLALALTRWIRDDGPALGLKGPKGLVLMSPWSDIGFSNSWGQAAYTHNADSDTIDDTFGPFATSLLLRGLPVDTMHYSPYLSPASLFIPDRPTGADSFQNFPPTYIVYGEAERLSLSIRELWQRLKLARKIAKSPQSTEDELLEMPDSVHDFMIFPWQAEEAAIVYEKLDEWLRTLLASEDDEPVSETPEVAQGINEVLDIAMVRRRRRESRMVDKSPVMRPMRRQSGMIRMIGDLQGEGMSMLDPTPLDLDSLPNAETAKGWLTPFTSQYEPGEFDWNLGDEWYEMQESGSSDEDREERKRR